MSSSIQKPTAVSSLFDEASSWFGEDFSFPESSEWSSVSLGSSSKKDRELLQWLPAQVTRASQFLTGPGLLPVNFAAITKGNALVAILADLRHLASWSSQRASVWLTKRQSTNYLRTSRLTPLGSILPSLWKTPAFLGLTFTCSDLWSENNETERPRLNMFWEERIASNELRTVLLLSRIDAFSPNVFMRFWVFE